MKTKTSKKILFSFFAAGLASVTAEAAMLQIEVQNLTPGQNFSPPAFVVHKPSFELYRVGEPAIEAVYMIAENGDTTAAMALSNDPMVHEVVVGEGIPAGETKTFMVKVPKGYRVSFVSMLASTNDGFFGLRGLRPPTGRSYHEYDAIAYDAGSEQNNESCAYVPGPPCNGSPARMTNGAEGFVSVHNGIHGIADLPPVLLDWKNPVATITVRSRD